MAITRTELANLVGHLSELTVVVDRPVAGYSCVARLDDIGAMGFDVIHLPGDAPGNIKAYIARLNAIRRTHPALQLGKNLAFYQADDDAVLFYGKMTPDRRDAVLVAVNLDPKGRRETTLHLPLDALGIGSGQPYHVRDFLREVTQPGRDPVQRIRLDPEDEPAFIFEVRSA